MTGDYSRGASGFWIENGKLAWPVSGITVAGNLKDMFLNMTAANDLQFKSSTNAPTVRIEGHDRRRLVIILAGMTLLPNARTPRRNDGAPLQPRALGLSRAGPGR